MDKTKNKMFFCISAIAAIAILAFVFAFAAAGSDGGVVDQNGEGVTVAASAVTTSSINYQGRLTDTAGEPLSGSYTMTFRLYEVASGGSARDTDSHSVEVTDGLFNTDIDFDPEYFDGRGLWLGITVGIDSEMSPRPELRPVPYALSLKPGANIVGASSVALQAESTHASGSGIRGDAAATSGTNYGVVGASKSPDGYGGYFYNHEGGTGVYGKGGKYGGYFTTDQGGTAPADRTAGLNVTTNYGYSDGIRAYVTGGSSYGVNAHTTDSWSEGVHAYATGSHSRGVNAITTGSSSEGVRASTSGDNSHGVSTSTGGDNSDGVHVHTSGEKSHGVYAYSDKHYSVYGIGKSGGYFTTNQAGTGWSDKTAGVNATTAYDYSTGVQAHTSGDYSTGVDAVTSGDHSLGVQASTTGENSPGVDAYTTGDSSDGVSASAWGGNSVGVRAYSVKDYGVYGKGKSGGYFTTNQGGTSGADRTAGVNVSTAYDYSYGVQVNTMGEHSKGICVHTTGNNHCYGVDGDTTGDYSYGVVGSTTGAYSHGVFARTHGDNSYGVYADSEKYYGIYANTGRSDHNYAFYTWNDNIYVGGKIDVVGTVDPIITESFNADPGVDYDVGDVVCLDDDSPYVKICTDADDTSVVGVVGPTLEIDDGEVSVVIMGYQGARPDEEYVKVLERRLSDAAAKMSTTDAETSITEKKSKNDEIALHKSEIEESKSITRQVVKVKADASYAPIKRGDLLTTSPTAGHAMKAQPVEIGGVEIHRPGTIIGKAVEPLESGTEMIEVFVTLQ